MVKLKIFNYNITIQDWEWTCDHPPLLKWLDSLKSPFGPSGADPYPDLTLAQEAVSRLGGKIINYDEPEYVEGRVY